MTYSKRQNKKTLGIKNLKGVSVSNKLNGKKYEVKFKAEVRRNGKKMYGGSADTAREAAALANLLFVEIYGNKRAALKEGYWNV